MRRTASKLDLYEKCGLSAIAKGVIDTYTHEYRDAGMHIHFFLNRVITENREKALSIVPPAYRDICAALDLETIHGNKPESWASEVALAWHPETGEAEMLHVGKGNRDYSKASPGSICGTVDLSGMTAENYPVVLDFKTGRAELGAPSDSLQLGFGAVAMARLHNSRGAYVGWVRILDGQGFWQVEFLDLEALKAMEERIRRIENAALAAEFAPESVTPTIGAHCKYCPAVLMCPAQMGLARELARENAMSDATAAELTQATLPRVLARLDAGEALLKRVRAHVDAYASTHPIRMPDGRIYGCREKSRESFDPVRARPVLNRLGLSAAIETSEDLTKASLKRAIDSAGLPRKTEKSALDELRACGAAVKKTYTTMDYFKPQALLADGDE